MDNIEIIQNAETWAKKHEKIINYHHDDPVTDFEDKKKAYIAGASSRYEEISQLQKKLVDMTKLKNLFALSLDIYDRDNMKLQQELKYLRDLKLEKDK